MITPHPNFLLHEFRSFFRTKKRENVLLDILFLTLSLPLGKCARRSVFLDGDIYTVMELFRLPPPPREVRLIVAA